MRAFAWYLSDGPIRGHSWEVRVLTSFTRAYSGWRLLVIALICLALGIASSPVVDISGESRSLGTSRYSFKRAERCLMREVNNIRARHGLRRLYPDKQLGYVARRHAETMSTRRSVYHDYNVDEKVTRWWRLGQNSGRGASCRSLTRAFMSSPSHRSQILGRFRFMGFGTQKRGDRLYVQQLFESRRDPGNIYNYP